MNAINPRPTAANIKGSSDGNAFDEIIQILRAVPIMRRVIPIFISSSFIFISSSNDGNHGTAGARPRAPVGPVDFLVGAAGLSSRPSSDSALWTSPVAHGDSDSTGIRKKLFVLEKHHDGEPFVDAAGHTKTGVQFVWITMVTLWITVCSGTRMPRSR